MTFSRPVVFDFVATPAELAGARASALWSALADGVLRRAADRTLRAGRRRRRRTQRLESRASTGALVLVA